MTLPGMLALLLLVASRAAEADSCTTYVLEFDGKTEPHYEHTAPVALSEVTRGTPMKLRRVGLVGGHRVYEASSSKLQRTIVWESGNWSFCTALVAWGDESIIVGIHPARVLRSENHDVLHIRVQYQGTGHFQESVFFTIVDGVLVHVRESPNNARELAEFYAAHKIKPYFKGLRFSEDSLTEERLFETEDEKATAALCVGCRVVVRYRLAGPLLLIGGIGFADHGQDREMFPKW